MTEAQPAQPLIVFVFAPAGLGVVRRVTVEDDRYPSDDEVRGPGPGQSQENLFEIGHIVTIHG